MLGRVSWCQVLGGLYIAALHTSPLILRWSVFYWWVPLIPFASCFQSFTLLHFTTDNTDIYFTKPRRKLIQWTQFSCSSSEKWIFFSSFQILNVPVAFWKKSVLMIYVWELRREVMEDPYLCLSLEDWLQERTIIFNEQVFLCW